MTEELKKHFDTVAEYLKRFEKEKTLDYCLQLLESGTVSVPELYETILAPALNRITILRAEEDSLIWQEHAMTAIVRSVIESAHPYVLKAREQYEQVGLLRKVVLVCPEDEYHELGIRMGADFFTIANFEALYIGCNTPQANIVSALQILKPDMIDIGVSNFLNLVSLKKIIIELREKIDPRIKIAVSGSAFGRTGKSAADFGADVIINSFADTVAFGRNYHEAGI